MRVMTCNEKARLVRSTASHSVLSLSEFYWALSYLTRIYAPRFFSMDWDIMAWFAVLVTILSYAPISDKEDDQYSANLCLQVFWELVVLEGDEGDAIALTLSLDAVSLGMLSKQPCFSPSLPKTLSRRL